MKVVRKHATVMPKLAMMADFIALGSRRPEQADPPSALIRLIIGSVMRKCF